jgi:hypothetical protein
MESYEKSPQLTIYQGVPRITTKAKVVDNHLGKKLDMKNIGRFYMQGKCKFGKTCRLEHERSVKNSKVMD